MSRLKRNASRRRRFNRLRPTAFPSFLLTESPKRAPEAGSRLRSQSTKSLRESLRPDENTDSMSEPAKRTVLASFPVRTRSSGVMG